MTLRVELKIVPYGDEDAIYPIAHLDISNVREIEDQGFGNRVCEYKVKLYPFVGEIRNNIAIEEGTVIHNRRDGSVALAEKACALMKDRF